MYMIVTRWFLILEFPFKCHPDSSKESELSIHKNKGYCDFSHVTCCTVRAAVSSFLTLLSGAAFPLPLHSSPPSFHAPSFLGPSVALTALHTELIYLPISVRREGFREERVEDGMVGRTRGCDGKSSTAAREGICHSLLLLPAFAYCLEPDVLCMNLYLIWELSAWYSFKGSWFIWVWMIYRKQVNSSLISYNQSKKLTA